MAGSNAVAVPGALIDLLAAEFADEADLAVDFSEPPRDLERQHIWGGRVAGPHDPHAMRAGSRRPRYEQLTWDLHLRVAMPGLTRRENATRALDLGRRIEERFAAADVHAGAGVDGCKQIAVVNFSMDSTTGDDDNPITVVTYSVAIQSVLI